MFPSTLLLLTVASADPSIPETAQQLAAEAHASELAWTRLTELCDTIGHRLSGSASLDRAVAWAADAMRADGLEVHLEPVEVPHWVRGPAAGRVLGEHGFQLNLLALGGSGSTPPGGLEADLAIFTDVDALEASKEELGGKVVLFNTPWSSYGETVTSRNRGPAAAAARGAVATLVRSVTPRSLNTPHTGATRFNEGQRPTPAAAIPTEQADRLQRLAQRGVPLRVHLDMHNEDRGTAPSHNVVGRIEGRSQPHEVIVLGCHLDSWDVGQGAQDDGAGCVTIMAAGALLRALPEAPRRSVEVVLYTNEENGLRGGRAFADTHRKRRVVAAIEDDTGAGAPQGFTVEARTPADELEAPARDAAIAALHDFIPALEAARAAPVTPGFSGSDVRPLLKHGAIGLGIRHDMDGYWPIHHTEADTLDKIDPADVRANVAAMAVMAWVLAEMPNSVLDAADATRSRRDIRQRSR